MFKKLFTCLVMLLLLAAPVDAANIINGVTGYTVINWVTAPTVVNGVMQSWSPIAPSNCANTYSAFDGTNTFTIYITWTDNSNNETQFNLERSINGGAYANLSNPAANATSANDATATGGSSYQYRIRAENSGAYSSYSTAAAAINVGTTTFYTTTNGDARQYSNNSGSFPAAYLGANNNLGAGGSLVNTWTGAAYWCAMTYYNFDTSTLNDSATVVDAQPTFNTGATAIDNVNSFIVYADWVTWSAPIAVGVWSFSKNASSPSINLSSITAGSSFALTLYSPNTVSKTGMTGIKLVISPANTPTGANNVVMTGETGIHNSLFVAWWY